MNPDSPAWRPPAISKVIVPPVWALFGLALEWALDRWAPVAEWIPAPWNLAGWVLVAGGLALSINALGLFRRAGTGIKPFTDATRLVVAGPYRFTRNPMYLGVTGALLGAAVLFGSATPFAVPPAYMALIGALFIRHEEAMMEATFGAEYLEFKLRVRRWL